MLAKFFGQRSDALSGERWLVLELRERIVRLTRVIVQPSQRLFVIENEYVASIDSESATPLREAVYQVCAKAEIDEGERMLLLTDRSWGATRTSEVSISRSDKTTNLSQAELSSLVDRGVCKMLVEETAAIADLLRVSPSFVRIIDVDVVQARLDGRRLLNPVGFSGKTVDLTLRTTGVLTSALTQMSDSLTADNFLGATEAGMSIALEIAARCADDDFVFGYIGDVSTSVYVGRGGVVQFVDSFGWGTETLFEGMARQCAGSRSFVETLLARYGRGEVSPKVAEFVERIAAGELALLSQGINAQRRGATQAFAYSEQPLPRLIFDPGFVRRMRLTISFAEVNERILGERGGFGVHYTKKADEKERDYALISSALSSWHGSLQGGALHRSANQRVHWLRKE